MSLKLFSLLKEIVNVRVVERAMNNFFGILKRF